MATPFLLALKKFIPLLSHLRHGGSQEFLKIDLSRIDKKACLRNLGAVVSPRANEMLAIGPILEFAMVDRRFIEESDVLINLLN